MMNVQNGEQPSRLKPLQSSEEARKPKGIAVSNRALDLELEVVSRAEGLPKLFAAAVPTDAMTRNQKATASQRLIWYPKSRAKRKSNMLAIRSPARSNHS